MYRLAVGVVACLNRKAKGRRKRKVPLPLLLLLRRRRRHWQARPSRLCRGQRLAKHSPRQVTSYVLMRLRQRSWQQRSSEIRLWMHELPRPWCVRRTVCTRVKLRKSKRAEPPESSLRRAHVTSGQTSCVCNLRFIRALPVNYRKTRGLKFQLSPTTVLSFAQDILSSRH